MKNTIFALSTIFGKSGVAIIRISGPDALLVARKLGSKKELQDRRAVYDRLFSIDGSHIIDDAIIIFFKGPNTFTGEDLLELHVHGSIAVINDILQELSQIDFLRLAEPGEFTKRAFYNSKFDLTKAEALADLIDAETRVQKDIAIRHLSGELENLYDNWRSEIIKALMLLEAFIDFPEDDIPIEGVDMINKTVLDLKSEISRYISRNSVNTSIASGIRISIVGAPNVGKSTLLNLLSKREAAIVSNIAGTTRDVIEVKIDLSGFSVILSDTAGIRETSDVIEREGVIRAKKSLKTSDIAIFMFDITEKYDKEHLRELIEDFRGAIEEFSKSAIFLLNKIDLAQNNQDLVDLLSEFDIQEENLLYISMLPEATEAEEQKIENLVAKLLILIKAKYHISTTEPVITKLRHINQLKECIQHLDAFSLQKPIELAAQDIRFAGDALGILTGKINVEEVLDKIFSNFCIGK